jgi:hypothetical protein
MKTLSTPHGGNNRKNFKIPKGNQKPYIEQVKQKTMKLVFVASSLYMQHYGERAKTGWLRIRIMCPNGVTFLFSK